MSALPQWRTLLSATGMSASCQKRAHAPQQFCSCSITGRRGQAAETVGQGPSIFAIFRKEFLSTRSSSLMRCNNRAL